MSKHRHQNKAEQIYKRTHGAASFHHKKRLYQMQAPTETEDTQRKLMVDDASIQPGAFEIYDGNEGAVSEHWREVDRILRNGDQTVFGC